MISSSSGALPDPEALLRLPGPLLGRLRHAAAEARYDGGLLGRAEAVAHGLFDAVRLPVVHAWLRGLDEPAAVWARLFAYRDAVDHASVRDALGDAASSALGEAGVLVREGDALRSTLRLMPFAGLLLASDEADARFDPVMGPGGTTVELWQATEVTPGMRVLDVGCGAGSLALAAARHGAREVVGVDLDPRAVAYSRFNALLNDVSTATFEVGDLLEPVRGRTFDLVLSQPPFVMQPPSLDATTFLHGGTRGDELALRLLGELPPAIAREGRALLLVDFPLDRTDTAVMERIRGALGSAPLQVLAVQAVGHSPDLQAVGYAAAAHSELGPDYAAMAGSYRDHLRALGITGTAHVLLDVRRPREGEPLYAALVEARGSKPYDASQLAEARAGILLAAADVPRLLAARVRASPHAWLVHERSLAAGDHTKLRLRFADGRARDQELSDGAAMFLDVMAGCTTLAEAIVEYARACEATPSAVEGTVVAFAREALVSGLLVQAED